MDDSAGHFQRNTRRFGILMLSGLVSCGMLACDGQLSLGEDDQEAVNQGKKEANDPSDPDDPSTDGEGPNGEEIALTRPHLRRLTPAQFENTVRHALGDGVVQEEDLPQFGDDIPTIGLNNDPSSLRITDVNVDSLYESTQALAQAAAEGTPVVSDCVAASGDACFGEIVDDVGTKLWRRPATAEEKDDLLATRAEVAQAGASRAEQAEFLVHVLLASPNTLYRSELGTEEDGVRPLTDYELASALSYTIWNGPPDAELMQLAADGELSDDETLREQARRMAEDERVAHAFTEFFMDYLKIDALFGKNKIDELGLTPEARAALVEGIRRDLMQIFSMPGATLLDPFRTESFHVSEESATFFGVPMVSGGDFEMVAMDPGERLGVLSHPGFLSVHSGEGDSGIVKRGVFTLEQLLCYELGAPPNDISESEDVPEDFDDATATSREVLTVRHSSQAECVGCHKVIDPAGFGFENYDGAGRYREVEKGDVQIDASGELEVWDETLTYDDSVGYIDALVSSEALRSCLSNKYFTYVLGDEPREAERELFYTAFDESGGDLNTMVESVIATPSFSARHPEEQQ